MDRKEKPSKIWGNIVQFAYSLLPLKGNYALTPCTSGQSPRNYKKTVKVHVTGVTLCPLCILN